MTELLHHMALAVAVLALAAAALRTATALTDRLLERLVAAAPMAAAAAVTEALALGLVDLGTNPVALTASALATWVLARLLVPGRRPGVVDQVAAGWRGLSLAQRAGAGALGGTALAWSVWLLRYPTLGGWDGVTYHLPEIAAWVRGGSPGTIEDVLPGWPVGSYPLANEVLLSWGAGIARSLAPIVLWPVMALGTLFASTWLALRTLEVPRLPAALATGALCAAPVLTSYQGNGPATDLPALAWLVCAAALAALAVRRARPALLAPALVAAALAVGTKTTTLPLAALVALVAVIRLRPPLRALRLPLGVAAVAALVVGGTWYLRNFVLHGSPLWPFITAPWGDPAPVAVRGLSVTFLDRPLESLARLGDEGYVLDLFLGGVILMAAAPLAALLARTRDVVWPALATVVSVLIWTKAPATGIPDSPGFAGGLTGAVFSTTRYLLPAAAAATLTVALAAKRRDLLGTASTAVLGLAFAGNLWRHFELGYPLAPSPLTPLEGAAVGAALTALAGVVTRLPPLPGVARPVIPAVLALAAGAVLAAPAGDLVERHANEQFFDSKLVRWFDRQAADGRPIAMAPHMLGVLAGDDLSREVVAIPRREPCTRIQERARRGYVVISTFESDALFGPSTVPRCVRRWRPVFFDGAHGVFDRHSLPAPAASTGSGSRGFGL